MNESSPQLSTGTIRVDAPENHPVIQLFWATDAKEAEVLVSDDNGPEKLVSKSSSGTVEIDWIQPGKPYIFRLYDSGVPRRLIKEVEICKPVFGKLTIEDDIDGDRGKIGLQWSITPSAIGAIYLSEDGEPEKPVCRGQTDKVIIGGLGPGIEYVFRLYADTKVHPLLDEVRFFREIEGNISIDYKPVPFSSDIRVPVQWSITPPVIGAIYLSEDGQPEKLVCRGQTDTVEIGGLEAGIEYVFRLYADTKAHPLLDEVRFFREIEGSISVHHETDPFTSDLRVRVQWSITPPAIGAIYLFEDGQPEKLVCRGQTDTAEIGGLEAGIEHVFRLYADTEAHPLLDEVRFFREVAGVITAAPNPIPIEAGSATVLHWEVTLPSMAEVCVAENGTNEKVVHRGASGSLEISALQAGIDYKFRLYSYPGSRTLLDEISVKLTEIPWSSLSERFKGGRTEGYSTAMAEFIGVALRGSLQHEEFPDWFRLWERDGVHVTPVHFYEPIPDSRMLTEDLWKQPDELPGVKMNEPMQRHLLCDVFPSYKHEYQQIPLDPTDDPSCFYLRNGRFEGLDPLIAYCMTRHYKPRQIIEVGSGYSTLILAQAARTNRNTELHSVEPYPEAFLKESIPGLTSLQPKKVEDIELSFFDTLKEGDFLFIDTSHVVRIGGDVNFLFLQVLPRLKPGVFVHVHDIFLPSEYPKEWVISRRRFWTEQYLLQAFLCYNSEFEVLVSSAYLRARFLNRLREVFPTCDSWLGGSFWMRRNAKNDAPTTSL